MRKASGMKPANGNFNKSYIKTGIAAVAAVLVAAGILTFIFRENLFGKGMRPDAARVRPTEEMLTAAATAGYSANLQFMRMKALLISDPETSPYILSWYLLPGQLLSMTPAQSEFIDATDQALLLRIYIARGDRKAASRLSDAIAKDFADGSGGILGARPIAEIGRFSGKGPIFSFAPELEPENRITGTSLEAGSAYLRALLEYASRWGGSEGDQRIRELSAALYSEDTGFIDDYAVVTIQKTDWLVGLTDYDQYTGSGEAGKTYRVFKLSAPDLRAFQILSATDASYAPMYDRALQIVRGGLISGNVPLYALAYSEEESEYIYFTGEEARVDAVSSLKTMLSLSEVGALPRESLSWIREQIFNIGYIYTKYDIITGVAASDVEATEAYGLILRIAVSEGDTDLYARTLTRLTRSLATLDTSPARYMIFRKTGERRNMTFAADNLSVVMAMTK